MPNAQLAATEPAHHAVSVWRHFVPRGVTDAPPTPMQTLWFSSRILLGNRYTVYCDQLS
jgi:hypothetical protein